MIAPLSGPRDGSPSGTRPRVSLIAAVARNGAIGRGNALPWHLPADLKRFKALTLGHPVVMGRKTWDSILAALGRPLPGRTSIVVSRTASLPGTPGAIVAATLPAAIAAAGDTDEVFVIGGAQIYALALPLADRLYLTEVDTEVDGDAWFPRFETSDFAQAAREPGLPEGNLHYDFVTYDRRKPAR